MKYLDKEIRKNKILKSYKLCIIFRVKQQLKHQMISTIKDYPISMLCKIAKVSKSG